MDEGESSQTGISDEELETLVADVVRYMLFKNFQQGAPVKREELTHIVTKSYKQRSLPATVINIAGNRLKSVFGLELRELQKVRQQTNNKGKPAAAGAAADGTRHYVLRNTLSQELQTQYVYKKESCPTYGLAVILIALIQLEEDKCPEETLWNHLRTIGIDERDESHPTFGNVKQAVEAVVKQRYIQKEKIQRNDGDGFVYRLAERTDESVRTQVGAFIEKLLDGGGDRDDGDE